MNKSFRAVFGSLEALSCLFFGSCARETFGSAGLSIVRFANLRTAATLFVWRRLSGRPLNPMELYS
ncbi:hypothetical protein EYC95_27960 [Pseudomonas sp. BGI-2]|nr:hypothetical protein EYC95_27960 [Pseudomonas sp. BGI-2]